MKPYLWGQQGATLIVSLIFLLIMTTIGLAGMEVVSMEEKIAGNARNQNIAFQAAEAALLDGESLIAEGKVKTFDGTHGFYEPVKRGKPNWLAVNWDSNNDVRSYSGPGFAELVNRSAYIIEDLGPASEGSMALNTVQNRRHFYRVTARSVGLNSGSDVILQTVYKH